MVDTPIRLFLLASSLINRWRARGGTLPLLAMHKHGGCVRQRGEGGIETDLLGAGWDVSLGVGGRFAPAGA